MTVIRHSACRNQRDLVLTGNLRDEGIEALLKFRRNQISAIFRAVNHVDVIVGIGMAHAARSPWMRMIPCIWRRASGARGFLTMPVSRETVRLHDLSR